MLGDNLKIEHCTLRKRKLNRTYVHKMAWPKKVLLANLRRKQHIYN